jgi:hypothetical protein
MTYKQPEPFLTQSPQPTIQRTPFQAQPQRLAPQRQFTPASQVKSPISLPQTSPQKINETILPKINLGKINSILNDPSILTIESPGPGKNLIVNKGGKIMPVSIALSKEEIDAIMNDISDKTRIPLISGGVFKTAFRGIMLTAVISDYIGTRFLIQKRNPFQRY